MFHCPECDALHDDPSDARLGLEVPCLDCVIVAEFAIVRARIEFLPAA